MKELAQKTGLRERKRILTRQALYKSALDLIRHEGFEQVSMQQIADRAGVSRATAFNYFPSKDHFLAAYHRDLTLSTMDQVSEKSGNLSGTSRITSLMQTMTERANSDPALARALIPRMFTSPILLAQDHDDETDLASWIDEAVRDGIAEQEIDPNLETDIFVTLLIGALSSTTLDWALGGAQGDLWSRLKPQIRHLISSVKFEAQKTNQQE